MDNKNTAETDEEEEGGVPAPEVAREEDGQEVWLDEPEA